MKYYNFNFYNLFLIFIFFLLLEGFYSFYYYKISFYIDIINFSYNSEISTFIWNENGLVEYLQIVFLFFSLVNLILFFKKKSIFNTSRFFNYFVYLYFSGLIYFFFEEISWGQQIFRWETPLFFNFINHQGETNLHNISNLFNEVPRSLLLIWCSLSFIFIKILYNYKNIKNITSFIFPNESLKKISYLIIIFVIPNLLIKKLNLYEGYPVNNSTSENLYFYPYPIEYIESYEVISLATFNFIKLSELHELLFTFYILIHSFYIKKLNLIKNSS